MAVSTRSLVFGCLGWPRPTTGIGWKSNSRFQTAFSHRRHTSSTSSRLPGEIWTVEGSPWWPNRSDWERISVRRYVPHVEEVQWWATKFTFQSWEIFSPVRKYSRIAAVCEYVWCHSASIPSFSRGNNRSLSWFRKRTRVVPWTYCRCTFGTLYVWYFFFRLVPAYSQRPGCVPFVISIFLVFNALSP